MSSFTEELEYVPLAELDLWSKLPLFEITKEFSFSVGSLGSTLVITVPQGFRSDFASFPWPLRLWFRPTDSRWAKAALIHDHVCRSKQYSRALADLVFLEGMIILKAGWRAWLFYFGVKTFGVGRMIFLRKPYYTVDYT